MTSKKGKRYCSVFGCLNNDSSNPGISFFNTPTEHETRLQWLRLIDREDLCPKSKHQLLVCEVHFRAEDISVNSHRKLLRKSCSPRLHLPDNKDDVEAPTNLTVDNSTQTDTRTCSVACQTGTIITSENVTQTTASLSAATPRKRKLKCDLSNLRKLLKVLEAGQRLDELQRDAFLKQCDRLLSKNLAEIVKAQVVLKSSYKRKA